MLRVPDTDGMTQHCLVAQLGNVATMSTRRVCCDVSKVFCILNTRYSGVGCGLWVFMRVPFQQPSCGFGVNHGHIFKIRVLLAVQVKLSRIRVLLAVRVKLFRIRVLLAVRVKFRIWVLLAVQVKLSRIRVLCH
jgi:hypothetical protein